MKDPIKVTIPIDHGNRLIKTMNFDFPASCVDGTTIASVGSDVLKYNDKEIAFTRSLQRQLNDKTELFHDTQTEGMMRDMLSIACGQTSHIN